MTHKPKLNLQTGSLIQSKSRPGSRLFHARFVRAGPVRAAGNSQSNIHITPEALASAIENDMFENKAVFVDHAGWFDYPSLDNLVGVTFDTQWNPEDQSVEGNLRLLSTPGAAVAANLLDDLLVDPEHAPDVGLSLVFYPVWTLEEEIDQLTITGITHVESVDLVFEPAADGRVLQALSSHGVTRAAPQNKTQKGEHPMTEESNPQLPLEKTPEPAGTSSSPGEMCVDETPPSQPAGILPDPPPAPPDHSQWMDALRRSSAAAMIQSSGLPAASTQRLMAQQFETPAAVESAIQDERAYLAQLQQDAVIDIGGTPPRSPQIAGMRTSMDRIELALEALLSGTRPGEGVQPLSGLRELYHLLSGDYEMSGVFHPERLMLANVNSSTMAGLVANALNKRVINEFQVYPQWWAPIVSEEDFASLQEVKWITLGGVGELPTVAEGAAYTELTWDDNTETATFAKKGGYLGLTLEAIDKDDTGRIRAAPRALAQAAWLTLSKAVSSIFTSASGVGPNLADGTALFDGSRGNLGTTALSFSEYTAVRTAMRKQTELNSSERLGALTAPRYILVPPDLEITALQILASEGQPGTANNDENPFAEGDMHSSRMAAARQRVIVVDLWTDTNNWAAAADPRLYPTIGVAYRYSRQPEIFSVASPTAGLMFTNDTMPIKVRFFFATGPMDYRGMYKENVA